MKRVAVLLCVALLFASRAFAQTDRNGSLLVTVLDETRGVLPGATVTIAGVEASNKAKTIEPAAANPQGQVTFTGLMPGRYSVTAEFSGFQTRTMGDVRVRAGENKQVIMLAIDRLSSSVTVERDRQIAASDRDITFGTVLTREQIDALSDDPEELKRQLMDIAGPDAKIFVDSFEGRELPPKALIKSIRVTRDQFAPEVHFAGELRIEVLTQPGVGPIRGGVRTGFYDSALDGENPLVGARGPAQSLNYGINLAGSLINQRASFNINYNGQDSYLTPTQNAAIPTGTLIGNMPIRAPNDNFFYSGGVDYALTRDQVLRVNFNGSRFTRDNAGIGQYDLIERAYSTDDSSYGLYLQQNGPIGRRFVLNTRLSITGNTSTFTSMTEAPTVIVNDAFTQGGAQRRGGTKNRQYWFNSDLDYVRGRHSIRTGVELQYSRFRTDSESNYLGTYTFASLEAFDAGLPRSYTRRIGDPNLRYTNLQGGAYIQDDFKLRKNFTLTGGVRYEAQTHVPDKLNLAPRAGFTWAPFKSGKTTLRGSWGIFYDWLPTGTYQQTLLFDGFRQRELNVINPSYPEPGLIGTSPPTNRYELADERSMAYSQRLSAGIAQTISRRVSANVLYSYGYRYELLVGRNINSPLNGVRPNPEFANVVVAASDGTGTQHSMNASVNLNLGPMAGPGGGAAAMGGGGMIMMPGGGMIMMAGPGPSNPGGKLWVWNRGLTVSGFYNLGRSYDNTDGAFAIPASLILANEWGPAAFDRRHNGFIALTTTALRNFTGRYSFNATSAIPLNVRTGYDDNGDLVFNDRPEGVGRNSERQAAIWNSSLNLSYAFTLGKKQVTTGGGVQISGGPAGIQINPTGMQSQPRYRLTLSVNVQNVFNQASYSGFSGVMTSPFFLQPTTAQGWRRVTFNTNVSF
jgi:hypothetical protein